MRVDAILLPKSGIAVFASMVFLVTSTSRGDEDQQKRVQAGKEFLNVSRLERWETYFSKGLPAVGKIVQQHKARTLSECWVESGFFWKKTFANSGEVTIVFGNPQYTASVDNDLGKYRISFVGEPTDLLRFVPIEAIPYASASSVCNTRDLIPRFMLNGKLVVGDYRTEAGRHFVELHFTDANDKRKISLVFDDAVETPLPSEVIFEAGGTTKLVQGEFKDVLGYYLPTRLTVEVPPIEGDGITTYNPEERLDRKMCYLSYYGLPEPNREKITNFGRSDSRWVWGLAIVVIGLTLGLVVLYRRSR